MQVPIWGYPPQSMDQMRLLWKSIISREIPKTNMKNYIFGALGAPKKLPGTPGEPQYIRIYKNISKYTKNTSKYIEIYQKMTKKPFFQEKSTENASKKS